MGYARAALKASDIREVGHRCKAIDDGYGGVTESEPFMIVHNRIRKLIVRPHYKGCPVENQNFTVKGLVNADCRRFTIDYKDRATGTVEKLNLEQYFRKRYNVILEYPELPVVEMMKKEIYYPMEFLVIEGLQRYPWKLDEYQTAHMIKVAVSRPAERLKAIQQSKAALDHQNDPVLKTFGLKVESQMLRTKARVLPNPEIEFDGNQHTIQVQVAAGISVVRNSSSQTAGLLTRGVSAISH
jgi:eukaryotic translation initiation factor 2C